MSKTRDKFVNAGLSQNITHSCDSENLSYCLAMFFSWFVLGEGKSG
jgi:hypothetical protein